MQSIYVTTKMVQCNVWWLKFFTNIKYTPLTGLVYTAIKALKYVSDQMTLIETDSFLSNIFPCLYSWFQLFFLLEDWYCKIQSSRGWDLLQWLQWESRGGSLRLVFADGRYPQAGAVCQEDLFRAAGLAQRQSSWSSKRELPDCNSQQQAARHKGRVR